MAIRVMPSLGRNILTDLVVLLGEPEHGEIQIGQRDAFLVGSHADQRTAEGHDDARHAQELLGGAGGVREDDCARVLVRARGQRRLDEEFLRVRVECQRRGRRVASGPYRLRASVRLHASLTKMWGERAERTVGRDDDDLGTLGDQFAKGLREGQIPTDQQPDLAQGSVEDLVRIGARGRQMRPLRVPDVLLAIRAADVARAGGDEVRDVVEDVWADRAAVFLDDGARHDIDVQSTREGPV